MRSSNARIEKRLNYIKPKQPLNSDYKTAQLTNRNEKRILQSTVKNQHKLKVVFNERQSTELTSKIINDKLSENKLTTRYKIKQSNLPLKSRYELPKENIGSSNNREPIKINQGNLSIITERKESIYKTKKQQIARKSITIKQKELQHVKRKYENKIPKLHISKNGKITKKVSLSKSGLLDKKIAKNRQGIVFDRLANKVVQDHIEDVDTGYQAIYKTNRQRKTLVRGTRGVKHFVKSSNRKSYLTSSAKHTGILQAQGMAVGALESENPVTDTASTTIGRTATNVKTTKEALKKGKTILRGKQTIKNNKVIQPQNVVRKQQRFAKMKGIRKSTAKILQQGSKGIKRVGNIFLAKLEEALASKALMIVGIFFIAIILFGVAIGGSGGALQMEEEEQLSFSSVGLSEDVLQWKDTVEAELEKYNLTEYADLLLVIIQMESKGKLPDVMQSSESIGLPPNSIVDPVRSIEVGVAYFKSVYDDMNKYNVDIQTLIQSYNFGNGFIPYVANNGGVWKQSLSDKFATIHAQKLGWNSYGDANYVTKAMRYLTIEDNDISLIGGNFDLEGGKLAFPVPNYESGVTSSYGWRVHPISRDRRFHAGTDIGAPVGATVIAVADGVVIESGWKGGYGKTVVIDHGSGVRTLYGHNSSLDVQAGQTVKVGQVIARVGSTGNSTGPHLHFEVMKNGEYTNPLNWLQLI